VGRQAKSLGLLVVAGVTFLGPRAIAAPTDDAQAPAAPEELPPAPVVPLRAPDPEPPRTVYFRDLDRLAYLVKEDAMVHQRANKLAIRRERAITLSVVGTIIGAMLLISASSTLKENCGTGGSTDCGFISNEPMFYAGMGMLVATPLAALVMYPSKADQLEVVSEWNLRHADRPLRLEPEPPRPSTVSGY
jgi:hypothetical protein